MKIHDVEQGTAEWLALRIGIPTASQFHRIVTPARGDLSKQARGYMAELVVEILLNQPTESVDKTEYMERGTMMEPAAVEMYQFDQEVTTRKVGFITTDDGTIGASPDRLIEGVNGAVEIKCPSPKVHVGYVVDGFGHDYQAQVMGQMLVGGFDFVDRYAYHPMFAPVRLRTYRDDAYIRKLEDALSAFNAQKLEMLDQVRKHGFYAERAATVQTAHSAEYGSRNKQRPGEWDTDTIWAG